MALVKSGLKSDLENLFKQPPFPESDVIGKWGDAMNSYGGNVTPQSGAISTAVTALKSGLSGFSQSNDAADKMESAFASFASALGAGMITSPVASGTAPTGQVGFHSIFDNTTYADASDIADKISGKIDDWMKTGTSTNLSGSAGPPWS